MTIYLIPLRKACNCYCRSSEVAPAALPLRVRADCGQSLLQLIQVPNPAHLCCRIRIWIISSGYSFVRYYLMIIAIMVKKKKFQKKTFFSLKKIYFTFLCLVTFTFS